MNVNILNVIIERLEKGSDLLLSLYQICNKKTIKCGWINAIGAMECARVAYYNQSSKQYEKTEINEGVELLALIGNVSLKENDISIHAHIVLSNKDGKIYGGHLLEGTRVFACEVCFFVLNTLPLERKYDKNTGLYLWP